MFFLSNRFLTLSRFDFKSASVTLNRSFFRFAGVDFFPRGLAGRWRNLFHSTAKLQKDFFPAPHLAVLFIFYLVRLNVVLPEAGNCLFCVKCQVNIERIFKSLVLKDREKRRTTECLFSLRTSGAVYTNLGIH